MKNQVFVIESNRKSEVEQLRKQEYANASGYTVDLSTLGWSAADEQSYVMVAESNGKLQATMRGEILTDLKLLEKKLECPWNFPRKLEMPVLLLSRAATNTQLRASGHNLALRYWFFRLALYHNIRFVLGTFVTGSPRENSLRQMGYEFYANPLGWQQSTYRSLREVQVVVLDLRAKGEQALQYCLERAGGSFENFDFREPFPELKMVNSL